MSITILCPQCSTKYNLRRERVALGIKRALCYCCHAEFDIEGAVLELLGTTLGTAAAPSAQPPIIAAESDAPSPADIQITELADVEHIASDSSGPAEQALNDALGENPMEELAIQTSGTEVEAMDYGDQPPASSLPGPIEGQADSIGDFPSIEQTDDLAAAEADGIPLPPIQKTTDDAPTEAASVTGEMGIEIESSDLIFDIGAALPAQKSEPDLPDTLGMDADRQSDISAKPFEDGEEPSVSETGASGTWDGDKPHDPIQVEVEQIDEDAPSGLPITIECPDEYFDVPIAALGQDAEVPKPQSADQPGPFGEDGTDPPVQISTSEKLETEDLELDVGDFPNVTTPFANEEAIGTISVSLGEDDDGSALEDHDASQTALKQEQSFSEEQALAGDTASLYQQEILATPTPSMSEPKSAELEDKARPGIVPIATPTGEGLSALAGSGPGYILDSLEENAPPDETELSAKAAPQFEKMPTPQTNEPQAEPAPPATNEGARIKVRIGDDLIENLTIEEVATMVEDRRLLENHYIARQFSENWIMASLVPTLRPIFEKIRAEKVRFEVPPPPSAQGGKRGLFNGLFGRN
jgi:hypothetical protein